MYNYVVQASGREDAVEEEEILRNPLKSGKYATIETSLIRPTSLGQDSQATNCYENIKVALIKLFGKTTTQENLEINQTCKLKKEIRVVKARDTEGYERSLLFVPKYRIVS